MRIEVYTTRREEYLIRRTRQTLRSVQRAVSGALTVIGGGFVMGIITAMLAADSEKIPAELICAAMIGCILGAGVSFGAREILKGEWR